MFGFTNSSSKAFTRNFDLIAERKSVIFHLRELAKVWSNRTMSGGKMYIVVVFVVNVVALLVVFVVVFVCTFEVT